MEGMEGMTRRGYDWDEHLGIVPGFYFYLTPRRFRRSRAEGEGKWRGGREQIPGRRGTVCCTPYVCVVIGRMTVLPGELHMYVQHRYTGYTYIEHVLQHI